LSTIFPYNPNVLFTNKKLKGG